MRQDNSKRNDSLRRFRPAVTIAIALLAFSTAACGSRDSASHTNTFGLTGTPFKIGLLADISGPVSQAEASAATVFQAWAASANRHGGIAGHPVEVVVKDTKGDSPTAASGAESLISDSSIAAVVSASDTTDAAVGGLLSNSGLPVVGGEGYNPMVWGKLKNWFGITTTFPQVVNMQVDSAKAVGSRTVSLLACAEDPSCAAAVPLFQAAATAAGTNYAGTLQVSATAPNYTAPCLDLINRNVNFVQLAVTPEVGGRVVQNCQTQGYTGYFGSSALSVSPQLYNTPNIKLAGALNAFPWWVDTAPVEEYRNAMSENGVAAADWAQPSSTALWATGKLIAKAVAAQIGNSTAPITRQTVLTAYGRISGETLGGLLPQPITYTAGSPSSPVNCYWLYQYRNGSFQGLPEPTCSG